MRIGGQVIPEEVCRQAFETWFNSPTRTNPHLQNCLVRLGVKKRTARVGAHYLLQRERINKTMKFDHYTGLWNPT